MSDKLMTFDSGYPEGDVGIEALAKTSDQDRYVIYSRSNNCKRVLTITSPRLITGVHIGALIKSVARMIEVVQDPKNKNTTTLPGAHNA